MKGLKSTHRAGELLQCIRGSAQWPELIGAYLGATKLEYPYTFRTRAGDALDLADWTDLTTAWVVMFGEEYRVSSSDRVIIDLGANIGIFSILAARTAPDARIIALEPFPANFERLLESVERNGLSGRVDCHPWAVAGTDRKVVMDAAPDIAGHSRRLVQATEADEPIEVQAYSLATLFALESIDEVDYLKIDIEGAEYELLDQSPDEVLRKVRVIGIECHGGQQLRAYKRLRSAGFKERSAKAAMPPQMLHPGASNGVINDTEARQNGRWLYCTTVEFERA